MIRNLLLVLLSLIVSCAIKEPAPQINYGKIGNLLSKDPWKKTIKKVRPAIVYIRYYVPHSLALEKIGVFSGTGFVVDRKNGIILTNRHIVGESPNRAKAVFSDYTELDLLPLYIDPVHDFGFFKFDPKKLDKKISEELKLYEGNVEVGTQIRVIGNDGGKELSISDGTISRIEKNAPKYTYGYYDFNTFYYQSNTNTSGGSSGSPVIDIDGNVIALNAGGSTRTSHSYFLPIHHALKALKIIQSGKTPPRGTLGTVFSKIGIEKVRQRKFPAPVLNKLLDENPKLNGLLIVKTNYLGSPSAGKLFNGDVIYKINNKLILSSFKKIQGILDDNLDKEIEIELFRGPENLKVKLKVKNLLELQARKYLWAGNALFHDLTYHILLRYFIEDKGVYVSTAWHMLKKDGIPSRIVITEAEKKKIENLEDWISYLKSKQDGETARIKYLDLSDQNREKVASFEIEKRWYPFETWVFDEKNLTWNSANATREQ